ncbi:hypothetical protein HMPREF0971_02049 [Segatella oris F0302]|uniref:Uncharacterized protein n=1 Tax=Segatella oris F0302 TaxID=649760 RepID=D1QST8_9BACT|nr:hypothetical protein HMPREF0971_02049 [Segatella oris F0302]
MKYKIKNTKSSKEQTSLLLFAAFFTFYNGLFSVVFIRDS